MDATCHTPPATQSESASSNPTPVEPYVQTLVLKYQHLEVLHPLLQNLFESPAKKELFTSVMRHDHKMLMTRSQRLQDHEVNAYEKAFCVLMENEDDRIGALEIYVEKILGVGEVEGCARDEEKEKEEWMVKGVAVRALLKSVSTSASASISIPPTSPTSPVPHPTTPTDPSIPNPPSNSILTGKLLPLYRAAKTDFHALPALTPTSSPRHVTEKTTAAKFLRDTVENCLQYLTTTTTTTGPGAASQGREREGEGEGCEGLMRELRETLEVAKEVAEVGSGGRKRRFDLVGGGRSGGSAGKRGGLWTRGGGRGGMRSGVRGRVRRGFVGFE